MAVYKYVSGAWQETSEVPKKYVNGAWEDSDGYAYENGVWVEKWSSFPRNYLIKDGVANPNATYTEPTLSSPIYGTWSRTWNSNGYYKVNVTRKSGSSYFQIPLSSNETQKAYQLVQFTSLPFTVPSSFTKVGMNGYVDFEYSGQQNDQVSARYQYRDTSASEYGEAQKYITEFPVYTTGIEYKGNFSMLGTLTKSSGNSYPTIDTRISFVARPTGSAQPRYKTFNLWIKNFWLE